MRLYQFVMGKRANARRIHQTAEVQLSRVANSRAVAERSDIPFTIYTSPSVRRGKRRL